MSAGTADGDSPDDDAANRGGDQTERTPPTVRDRTVGRDRRVALALVGVGVVARQPGLVLTGAVGVGYAVYARIGEAPEATIEVERTVSDDTPAPDDDVVVTVRAHNVGDAALPDLRLVDGVPPGLEVVDGPARIATALRPGDAAASSPSGRAAANTSGSRCAGSRETPPALKSARPSSRRRPGSSAPRSSRRAATSAARADDDIPWPRSHRRGRRRRRVPRHARVPPRRPRQADRLEPAGADGELATLELREERAATVVLLIDARESAYAAAEPTPTPPWRRVSRPPGRRSPRCSTAGTGSGSRRWVRATAGSRREPARRTPPAGAKRWRPIPRWRRRRARAGSTSRCGSGGSAGGFRPTRRCSFHPAPRRLRGVARAPDRRPRSPRHRPLARRDRRRHARNAAGRVRAPRATPRTARGGDPRGRVGRPVVSRRGRTSHWEVVAVSRREATTTCAESRCGRRPRARRPSADARSRREPRRQRGRSAVRVPPPRRRGARRARNGRFPRRVAPAVPRILVGGGSRRDRDRARRIPPRGGRAAARRRCRARARVGPRGPRDLRRRAGGSRDADSPERRSPRRDEPARRRALGRGRLRCVSGGRREPAGRRTRVAPVRGGGAGVGAAVTGGAAVSAAVSIPADSSDSRNSPPIAGPFVLPRRRFGMHTEATATTAAIATAATAAASAATTAAIDCVGRDDRDDRTGRVVGVTDLVTFGETMLRSRRRAASGWRPPRPRRAGGRRGEQQRRGRRRTTRRRRRLVLEASGVTARATNHRRAAEPRRPDGRVVGRPRDEPAGDVLPRTRRRRAARDERDLRPRGRRDHDGHARGATDRGAGGGRVLPHDRDHARAREQAAETTTALLRAAGEAGTTRTFDLNYRAKLWEPETARAAYEDLFEHVDILFVPDGTPARCSDARATRSRSLTGSRRPPSTSRPWSSPRHGGRGRAPKRRGVRAGRLRGRHVRRDRHRRRVRRRLPRETDRRGWGWPTRWSGPPRPPP